MIKISELAAAKVKEAIDNYGKPVLGIRAIAQAKSPFQVSYGLAFVDEKNVTETDQIVTIDDINVYIEEDQKQYLRDSTEISEHSISRVLYMESDDGIWI